MMAPANAAALFIVARMLLRRSADPWLRVVAGSTLVQQMVGIFYAPAGRYYYLTWLLTALVTCVWLHDEGLPAFRKRFPAAAKRISAHRFARVVAQGLARIAANLDPARPARAG